MGMAMGPGGATKVSLGTFGPPVVGTMGPVVATVVSGETAVVDDEAPPEVWLPVVEDSPEDPQPAARTASTKSTTIPAITGKDFKPRTRNQMCEAMESTSFL